MRVQLPRPTRRAPEPQGSCVFGSAQADLELPPGIPTAGYSIDGCRPRGASSPMLARACWLEDAAGRCVSVVAVDMLAGSRWLWERAGALLAESVGLDRRALLLCGTHTHTGPGCVFGDALFDLVGCARPGFDPDLAEHLARRIALAVEQARAGAVPARVASGTARLWGLVKQASLAGFQRTPEAQEWDAPGMPGEGAPGALDRAWRAVDPRLQLLSWWGEEGELLGVLGVAPGHATALGHDHRRYDADWFGEACRAAGAALGAPVMLVAGPEADGNVLLEGWSQGPALSAHVGAEVAARLVAAVEEGRAGAEPFDLELRFGLLRPGEQDALASSPVFGLPALGGAEDGRSFLYHRGLARPGATSWHYPADHPQHPKFPVMGPLQGLVGGLRGLAGPPELPLQRLRVGRLSLAFLPFELSFVSAWRIATDLGAPEHPVAVVGCAGSYAGYAVSPEAFDVQDYEGASTLWGRQSLPVLRRVLAALRTVGDEPDDPGPAVFHTAPRRRFFGHRS